MKEKFIKLIDLKSIITIIVVVAMVVFTGLGIIGTDLFITSVGLIIAFYFNKKKDAENDKNSIDKTENM